MNDKWLLRISLVVTAVFALPASRVAVAADFQAAVDWIYYEDAAGRQIDYSFSPGTLDADGVVDVPAGAVTLPGSESGASFTWRPYEGFFDLSLSGGMYYMSVPQALPSIVEIPTADITVDGSPADWGAVGLYAEDLAHDVLRAGVPSGCDVEYVKLAYSPDRSRFHMLWKLTSDAGTDVWYRLGLDKNLDGRANGVTDFQIDIAYLGSSWDVISQGWNSDDGWDWYPVAEDGVAAVLGQYVEASVDCSAFALPANMDVHGLTMQGVSPYVTYDTFRSVFGEAEGGAILLYSGLVEPAPTSWQCAARITGISNPGFGDSTPYYHAYGPGLAGGSANRDLPQPHLRAGWGAGDRDGTDVDDDALYIKAFVETPSDTNPYYWLWGLETGEGVTIAGVDPATAVVDLMIDVTNNGQTATFYYRVNSEDAWQEAVSHTLPPGVGTMYGMPTSTIGVGLGSSFDRYAPVYRFWHETAGRHFYTISRTERDKLIDAYSHIWSYEGPVYYAYAEDSNPGTMPVYRFWSNKSNSHFYTISESEKDKLMTTYSHVWTYEGPAFYAYPDGQQPDDAAPVYRFWSGQSGSHFYTMSESEKNKLMTTYSHVWTYEGVAWHAPVPQDD